MPTKSSPSKVADKMTLALTIAKRFVEDGPGDGIYNTEEFKDLGFSDGEDLDDALSELEDDGLIEVGRHMGGDEWNFGNIQPQPSLVQLFTAEHLGFDPAADVALVLEQVLANSEGLNAEQLESATKLTGARVAIAAHTIEAAGMADVRHHLGGFQVTANGRTRRLLRSR